MKCANIKLFKFLFSLIAYRSSIKDHYQQQLEKSREKLMKKTYDLGEEIPSILKKSKGGFNSPQKFEGSGKKIDYSPKKFDVQY